MVGNAHNYTENLDFSFLPTLVKEVQPDIRTSFTGAIQKNVPFSPTGNTHEVVTETLRQAKLLDTGRKIAQFKIEEFIGGKNGKFTSRTNSSQHLEDDEVNKLVNTMRENLILYDRGKIVSRIASITSEAFPLEEIESTKRKITPTYITKIIRVNQVKMRLGLEDKVYYIVVLQPHESRDNLITIKQVGSGQQYLMQYEDEHASLEGRQKESPASHTVSLRFNGGAILSEIEEVQIVINEEDYKVIGQYHQNQTDSDHDIKMQNGHISLNYKSGKLVSIEREGLASKKKDAIYKKVNPSTLGLKEFKVKKDTMVKIASQITFPKDTREGEFVIGNLGLGEQQNASRVEGLGIRVIGGSWYIGSFIHGRLTRGLIANSQYVITGYFYGSSNEVTPLGRCDVRISTAEGSFIIDGKWGQNGLEGKAELGFRSAKDGYAWRESVTFNQGVKVGTSIVTTREGESHKLHWLPDQEECRAPGPSHVEFHNLMPKILRHKTISTFENLVKAVTGNSVQHPARLPAQPKPSIQNKDQASQTVNNSTTPAAPENIKNENRDSNPSPQPKPSIQNKDQSLSTRDTAPRGRDARPASFSPSIETSDDTDPDKLARERARDMKIMEEQNSHHPTETLKYTPKLTHIPHLKSETNPWKRQGRTASKGLPVEPGVPEVDKRRDMEDPSLPEEFKGMGRVIATTNILEIVNTPEPATEKDAAPKIIHTSSTMYPREDSRPYSAEEHKESVKKRMPNPEAIWDNSIFRNLSFQSKQMLQNSFKQFPKTRHEATILSEASRFYARRERERTRTYAQIHDGISPRKGHKAPQVSKGSKTKIDMGESKIPHFQITRKPTRGV